MNKRLLLLALASFIFLGTGSSAHAQSAVSVTDLGLKIQYPNNMTFAVKAESSSNIAAVELVVRFPGATSTRLKALFTPAAQVNTSIIWNFRGSQFSAVGGYLPPGAQAEYSWHVQDQAGNAVDTPYKAFRVDDNRRTWQQLKNGNITLYWYDGGPDFGKQILAQAIKTLAAIEQDIGATLSSPVQIFIYGDRQEFLDALSESNHEWAGGTVNETFELVLINASANELDYALSTTPHELTHLVLAQYLKGPYADITMPLWMNEGLAVYHTYVPPKNEPQFERALRRGIQSDTLFRLRSLSLNFPNDESVVDLAYGESYSVVDFMVRTYGRDKLKQIMTLFKNGTTADDAFTEILGVDEDGLENAWRKSVGAQIKTYAKLPTATPGGVPTLSFSSADTPTARTPAATAVAQAQTPAPVLTPTPTPAPAGAGGLCGLPITALGLAAFAVWRQRPRE